MARFDDTGIEARVAALVRAELAARNRRRWARARGGRALATLCLGLLLALVPLGLLAAHPFTDLKGGVHDPNIDAIYNAGVTTGCVPNREYCPTANVTREEMASFLARLGGLGGNPPVANARTAETAGTAASAGHATSADTAGDANTVGGYAPSGLARVARTRLGDDKPITETCYSFAPARTVTLTAPAAGFALVSAGAVAAHHGGAGTGQITAQLRHEQGGSNAVSPTAQQVVTPTLGRASMAVSWVFPVEAGAQSFVLNACQVQLAGSSKLSLGSPWMTALFVPFGPDGGTTLDQP